MASPIDDPPMCTICFELAVKNESKAITELKCGHNFHFSCICPACQVENGEVLVIRCPNCREVERNRDWPFPPQPHPGHPDHHPQLGDHVAVPNAWSPINVPQLLDLMPPSSAFAAAPTASYTSTPRQHQEVTFVGLVPSPVVNDQLGRGRAYDDPLVLTLATGTFMARTRFREEEEEEEENENEHPRQRRRRT